jgi:hypothetical protein
MRKVNILNKKGMRTSTPRFIGSFLNFKALGAKRQKFLHQRLKEKRRESKANTAYYEA